MSSHPGRGASLGAGLGSEGLDILGFGEGFCEGFGLRIGRCAGLGEPRRISLVKGSAEPRDLGQDRRPRLGVLGTDLGHDRRPRLGVPMLNEWLSGGLGLRPYCMSVQCGRVGNPAGNHKKPTDDFENQQKLRDPGLVRIVNRTRRLLTQTVVTENWTYK